MRLWIWSDVHLEMQNLELPLKALGSADAIVCAGDLCHADDLATYAQWIIERYDLPMVFVPGNHEFYRGSNGWSPRSLPSDRVLMQEAQDASKKWKHRLFVLDDSAVIFGDTRILGGTLWTDFELGTASTQDIAWNMNHASGMLADFRQIRMSDLEMITAQDMLLMHRTTRSFIENHLSQPFEGKTVVVTHHLPHLDCTPSVYRDAKANYMFASGRSLDGLLLQDSAPQLWVCGHTHHPVDVTVGQTRIVCNPVGYLYAEDERENGFRWDLVIDTEELP